MITLALLQAVVFVSVAAAGTAVVFTRHPVNQAIGLAFYGILLALMFFLLQAPDVALSQLVIGAVMLPLMALLALARMRREESADQEKRP